MPLERISQGFKDISMTFQSNPLTGDLIVLKNENAIARSVKNIVLTVPGEKPFDPRFGSQISLSFCNKIQQCECDNGTPETSCTGSPLQ